MHVRRGTRRTAHGAWLFVVPMLMVILASALAPLSAAVVHSATNPFGDVPRGHWAYGALAEFARLGLVEGYSVDAFSGQRLVTRYEMAWAVARLSDRAKDSGALTTQQRDLLALLNEEFAGELALLAGTGRYAGPAGGMAGTRAGSEDDGSGALGANVGAVSQAQLSAIGHGTPASPQPSGTGGVGAGEALALEASPAGDSMAESVLGVIPGKPRQLDTSETWPSLRLRLDPGMTAALSALPGEVGREAFTGGKRLSELLTTDEAAAAPGGAVEPAGAAGAGANSAGSPQQALSIPLDDQAKAELSWGGPPAPGGIAPDEGNDVVARLDLKYALSQLAMFRASYELVKGEDGADQESESKARATTLLGIDYKFALSDSAFIKAGYTYSRITDLVPKGIEWSGSASPEGEAPDPGSKAAGVFGDYTLPGLSLDARKTTASFGVGYTFAGTTSIVLGYRLIDFQDLDPETMVPGSHRTNVATAELTIRF